MNIDLNKIIINNFSLVINENQLEEIKKTAIKERARIYSKCLEARINKVTLYNKALEVSYKSSRNQSKSIFEKALLASEIAFDDDEFVKVLVNDEYDKSNLELLFKLLKYIKQQTAKNNMQNIDQKYLKLTEKYLKELQAHFDKYIGKCDIVLILNKINKILSYNSELLSEQKPKVR